jgi:hypothetical protein
LTARRQAGRQAAYLVRIEQRGVRRDRIGPHYRRRRQLQRKLAQRIHSSRPFVPSQMRRAEALQKPRHRKIAQRMLRGWQRQHRSSRHAVSRLAYRYDTVTCAPFPARAKPTAAQRSAGERSEAHGGSRRAEAGAAAALDDLVLVTHAATRA